MSSSTRFLNSEVMIYIIPPDVSETELTGSHGQDTNDSVYVKTRNVWFQSFVDGFSKALEKKDGVSAKWALSVEGIDPPSVFIAAGAGAFYMTMRE